MKSLNDVHHFINFAANFLGIKTLPKINLVGANKTNKIDAFSFFDPKKVQVTVRITDRHPVDIARSISHELIHFKQLQAGDEDAEDIKENEANELAGKVMQAYDTQFPEAFKDKAIVKEDFGAAPVAVNSMGNGGAISTFDPILNKNKQKKTLKDVLSRKDLKRKNNGK